jgi:transcriptional regulator with XRE-family HTH domain
LAPDTRKLERYGVIDKITGVNADAYMTIDKLKAWIERRNLTRNEAAELLALSPSALSRKLSGKRSVGRQTEMICLLEDEAQVAMVIDKITGVNADAYMTIDKLKAWIERRNLTRNEAAELLALSPSALSRKLSGKRSIGRQTEMICLLEDEARVAMPDLKYGLP